MTDDQTQTTKWCHGPAWAQAGATGDVQPSDADIERAELAVAEQWAPWGSQMLAVLRSAHPDSVASYYKILCRSLAADPDVFRGFYMNHVTAAAGRSVGGEA